MGVGRVNDLPQFARTDYVIDVRPEKVIDYVIKVRTDYVIKVRPFCKIVETSNCKILRDITLAPSKGISMEVLSTARQSVLGISSAVIQPNCVDVLMKRQPSHRKRLDNVELRHAKVLGQAKACACQDGTETNHCQPFMVYNGSL